MITFDEDRQRRAALAACQLAYSLMRSMSYQDAQQAFYQWDRAHTYVTALDIEDCIADIKEDARNSD